MAIKPTREQIGELLDGGDGPVVMLNLLKFERSGGTSSYASYGEGVRSLLERTGAKVIWQGRVDSVVIGGSADEWDSAILVQYPSRKAFLDMVSRPDYSEVSKHRTAALVDSRLLACTEVFRAGS